MDAMSEFFEKIKKIPEIQGHFVGLLYILIGRRITKPDGTDVCPGLTWRDLSLWLKKVRWDPEQVRELGINPDDLHPRDRQRYWYSAIARTSIDSPAAREAGKKVAEALAQVGYLVSGDW